jgi:hypothetical protein
MVHPRPSLRSAAALTVLAVTLAAIPVAAQTPAGRPTSLGATVGALRDTLDAEGAFTELVNERSRRTFGDGTYDVRMIADNQSAWDWTTVSDPAPVLRAAVTTAMVEGQGAAGPMCGTGGDRPGFYFGVVTSGSDWLIGRIGEAGSVTVTRGALDDSKDRSTGATSRIAIECAVTGEGGDRILLEVDGTVVADVTDVESIGPFSRAGMFTGTPTAPFEARYDDFETFTGPAYAPNADPGPLPSGVPADLPDPGLTSLGADDLALEESYDDETVWPTSADATGSVAYEDGQLRISLTVPDRSRWSLLRFERSGSVMGIETDVTVDPAIGIAGPACGSSGDDPNLYYAAVTTENELEVGSVVDGSLTIIERVTLPETLDLRAGGTARVEIQCAVTDAGDERIAAWVDDILVADLRADDGVGPYQSMGAIAISVSEPFSAAFDDLVVRAGEYAPVGATPPSGVLPGLLETVPPGWRERCREVPADAATGQVTAILCARAVAAGAAGAAEYYRYDSLETLRAAFDQHVAGAGELPGDDCAVGPTAGSYTIDGATAGGIACHPDPRSPGSLLIAWTDERLLTMAVGSVPTDDFAALWAWWLEAGPIR